jgi:hypothetical protein
MTSARKKKFKAVPSARKIMATVSWDCEGVIHIAMLPSGRTINSDVYVETLKKVKKRFQRVCPHKDMIKELLHHDNARPHTSLHTREASVDCPASSTKQLRSGSFQLPSC